MLNSHLTKVLGATLVMVTVVWPMYCHAASSGTRWVDVDVDEAMKLAKKTRKNVLIKFEASWCRPCKRLEREVFRSAEAAEATAHLIALKLDFDDPKNRQWVQRYVVLGLPTAVIVSPSGLQLTRLMGYQDKQSYLSLLRQDAKDPLPSLRAALARSPSSDEARLALGKALLVRSGAKESTRNQALALLEPLLWRAETGLTEAELRATRERAAQVLFLLGRYHHRVRRAPEVAQHVWRSLAQRYPKTSWASGAWSWFASSQAELGRASAGAVALERWSEAKAGGTDAVGALWAWLRFCRKHGLTSYRPRIAKAAQRLLDSKHQDVAALKRVQAALTAWMPQPATAP